LKSSRKTSNLKGSEEQKSSKSYWKNMALFYLPVPGTRGLFMTNFVPIGYRRLKAEGRRQKAEKTMNKIQRF